MAAPHPERKTIKHKVLTNVIPSALAGVSFIGASPIIAIMFLNKKLSKMVKPSSNAASFQEERFAVPRDWLIKKITISEAEAAHPGIRDERMLQFPNAGKPFGFANHQRGSLKAKMKPGDELWLFRSSGEFLEKPRGPQWHRFAPGRRIHRGHHHIDELKLSLSISRHSDAVFRPTR